MSASNPNKKPLSVLVAAAEATPLAREGNLGDLAGHLPVALSALGCRSAVVLPAYREILETAPTREVLADLPVWLGEKRISVDILETRLAWGVPAFLVRHDPSFARFGMYGDHHGPYPDNGERFILFSRAVVEMCRRGVVSPDVILGNDWHTGLVMALLDSGALPGTAGVFCIHDMGYPGLVPPDRASMIGLPDRYYDFRGLEFFGNLSLLKAGVAFADRLVAVSETYAREIRTPGTGAGLEGLLNERADRLCGIVNGVDWSQWDPAQDPHLAAPFTVRDRSGKAACKEDLLARTGLSPEFLARPVLGLVSRLVAQKGLDIFLVAARGILDLGVGIVVLGTGDSTFEQALSGLARENPGRFSATIAMDPPLCHRILAGSDLLCVPSRVEPCGQTHLHAMAYGALPVVRATGGLADTVEDPGEGPGPGTGFTFKNFWAGDLTNAVARALDAFHDRPRWDAMTTRAMETVKTFTWDRAARRYLEVFHQALETGCFQARPSSE